MAWTFLVWVVIFAFVWAMIEIQIEGKDGWAKNLPTWRLKNRLTDFVLAEAPLTGYHFWMIIWIMLIFHLPFFSGTIWSLAAELQLLAFFLIFLILEDFLWFVLNPAFGISKFNPKHVTWHHKWLFSIIPVGYVMALGLAGILLFASTKA